jgi:hypothetical protein
MVFFQKLLISDDLVAEQLSVRAIATNEMDELRRRIDALESTMRSTLKPADPPSEPASSVENSILGTNATNTNLTSA